VKKKWVKKKKVRGEQRWRYSITDEGNNRIIEIEEMDPYSKTSEYFSSCSSLIYLSQVRLGMEKERECIWSWMDLKEEEEK